MEKLITLLALRLIFKNEKTVVELYKEIYPDKKIKQIKKVSNQPKNNMGTFVKPKNNKQKELVDGLNFLKNKKNKTKKDRESIGILESVLKNLS